MKWGSVVIICNYNKEVKSPTGKRKCDNTSENNTNTILAVLSTTQIKIGEKLQGHIGNLFQVRWVVGLKTRIPPRWSTENPNNRVCYGQFHYSECQEEYEPPRLEWKAARIQYFGLPNTNR